jgi:hypothetical protein
VQYSSSRRSFLSWVTVLVGRGFTIDLDTAASRLMEPAPLKDFFEPNSNGKQPRIVPDHPIETPSPLNQFIQAPMLGHDYLPSIVGGSQGRAAISVTDKGYFTESHIDELGSITWVGLCRGKKQWNFYSPDLQGGKVYVQWSKAALDGKGEMPEPTHSISMEAGDVLISPSGWIHDVGTLENSFGISSSVFLDQCLAGLGHALKAEAEQVLHKATPTEMLQKVATGMGISVREVRRRVKEAQVQAAEARQKGLGEEYSRAQVLRRRARPKAGERKRGPKKSILGSRKLGRSHRRCKHPEHNTESRVVLKRKPRLG